MFPATRQEKLNPILEALKKVPGIASVQQDDFDSVSIRIVMELAGTKYQLTERLQDTKRRVAAICKAVGYEITDWPQKSKEYSGMGFGGKAEYYDHGYDHHRLTVDVNV